MIFNMSGGAQATPVISVNTNGVITATAGSKSATHTLSGGDDVDFTEANILKGKTIFGKTGTFPKIAVLDDFTKNVTATLSGNQFVFDFTSAGLGTVSRLLGFMLFGQIMGDKTSSGWSGEILGFAFKNSSGATAVEQFRFDMMDESQSFFVELGQWSISGNKLIVNNIPTSSFQANPRLSTTYIALHFE